MRPCSGLLGALEVLRNKASRRQYQKEVQGPSEEISKSLLAGNSAVQLRSLCEKWNIETKAKETMTELVVKLCKMGIDSEGGEGVGTARMAKKRKQGK